MTVLDVDVCAHVLQDKDRGDETRLYLDSDNTLLVRMQHADTYTV